MKTWEWIVFWWLDLVIIVFQRGNEAVHGIELPPWCSLDSDGGDRMKSAAEIWMDCREKRASGELRPGSSGG